MHGDRDRAAGAQRAGVEGECSTWAPTCWASSGRPVCSQASRAGRWAIAAGPATIARGGRESAVALGVGALADDREVGAGPVECGDKPVDVAISAPRSAGTSAASTSTRGVKKDRSPHDPHGTTVPFFCLLYCQSPRNRGRNHTAFPEAWSFLEPSARRAARPARAAQSRSPRTITIREQSAAAMADPRSRTGARTATMATSRTPAPAGTTNVMIPRHHDSANAPMENSDRRPPEGPSSQMTPPGAARRRPSRAGPTQRGEHAPAGERALERFAPQPPQPEPEHRVDTLGSQATDEHGEQQEQPRVAAPPSRRRSRAASAAYPRDQTGWPR